MTNIYYWVSVFITNMYNSVSVIITNIYDWVSVIITNMYNWVSVIISNILAQASQEPRTSQAYGRFRRSLRAAASRGMGVMGLRLDRPKATEGFCVNQPRGKGNR